MSNNENWTVNTGGGTFNRHIQGSYIQGNYYAAGKPQSLVEAASEIQALIKQLETSYPSDTPERDKVVAKEVVKHLESNPTLKQKVIKAGTDATLAALEKAIDNPAGAFITGFIKGWKEFRL